MHEQGEHQTEGSTSTSVDYEALLHDAKQKHETEQSAEASRESIEATPVRPEDDALTLTLNGPREPMWAGGSEEGKHIIRAEVGGHEVSLVERPHDDRYVKHWVGFSEAGMPVVPLLRTAEIAGEHKIISTDLKADGSELYGKALISAILDDEDPRERPPARELDDAFVKLTDPERIAEVEERLRALADQATENYLRLPFDDPFELQIHPDGSWEPIILDLRFAYVTAPEKRTEDTRARLEMENSFAVEKYLGFVAELREVMLDHPEKLQQD